MNSIILFKDLDGQSFLDYREDYNVNDAMDDYLFNGGGVIYETLLPLCQVPLEKIKSLINDFENDE